MEKSNVEERPDFGYIYPNHYKYHFLSFYISMTYILGIIQSVFQSCAHKFLRCGYKRRERLVTSIPISNTASPF